ncbi:hypothetical protein METBIDRAFT_41541, partial [Metschnikowia bicuspidata var. bicuspidata NRRL YB-4993]
PIVNGLNFQSRIEVRLTEIGDFRSVKEKTLPVNRDYAFEAPDLAAGEYELTINAYDFIVRAPRWRIFVDDTETRAFVDAIASESYNISSQQIIQRDSPLTVPISGFKSYYESTEGRLTEVLMNSPFGFIFRSKLYSLLFFGTLVIMAFPYVIPYVAPDFAEQYQKMQAEMNAPPQENKPMGEILSKAAPKNQAISEKYSNSGKRTRKRG